MFILSFIYDLFTAFLQRILEIRKPYCDVNKTIIYNTLKNITLFYMNFSRYNTLNASINC